MVLEMYANLFSDYAAARLQGLEDDLHLVGNQCKYICDLRCSRDEDKKTDFL